MLSHMDDFRTYLVPSDCKIPQIIQRVAKQRGQAAKQVWLMPELDHGLKYHLRFRARVTIRTKSCWTFSLYLAPFLYLELSFFCPFWDGIVIPNSCLKIEFPLPTPCLNVALNSSVLFHKGHLAITLQK